MKKSTGTALAAALVLGLAGCGGGGGGGGGSGVPLLPIVNAPPPPPAPAPPAVAELKLTVEIDGSAATPDSSGKYAVAPGQLVAVKASDSAAWLGSAGGSGVTRTDVDTGTAQWISRFANPGATGAGGYKLVANASDNRSVELNFTVGTGDYGNGDYMVFAANGSRQKLHVDFDAKTYSVTDAAGDKTSGTFSMGIHGWMFTSSRVVGTNNTGFTALKDTFVGAFPFAAAFTTPVSYKTVPFVATRAFVVSPDKLDGTYDRARIEFTGAGAESAIAQIQISGGGTVMKQCNDLQIYRIENCPSGSVTTSVVAADAEPGMWTLKDATTGTLLGRFSIANVEGDKVYLSAGVAPITSSQILSVGVPAAASYAAFDSGGWTTAGTTDFSNVTPTQYTLLSTGPVPTTTLALSALTGSSPTGIRLGVSGADSYFAMRSSRIELLIGARSPSPQHGFLHIGVTF
jgi:hypothetical protein